jgi:hypothetical protein
VGRAHSPDSQRTDPVTARTGEAAAASLAACASCSLAASSAAFLRATGLSTLLVWTRAAAAAAMASWGGGERERR